MSRRKKILLQDEINSMHRRMNSENEYIHELFERVSRLEYQLAPKCKQCNHILPKDYNES
jgi:hypothetical protein